MSQALSLPAGHDTLLPQPPGGNGPGAALALLVHVGLIVALTNVVEWRTRTPEVVSAELWASVPQTAAPPPELPKAAPPPPPPPPPAPAAKAEPPPPREADIALEKARQRKAEDERRKAEELVAAERKRAALQQAENEKKKLAKKAEDDKRKLEDDKRKLEADKKKAAEALVKREHEAREAKAEEARLAKQREANLRRMMGQAAGTTGTPGSTGTAAQSAGPSGQYGGRLIAAVRRNIVYTGSLSGNPVATVEVTAAPGGSIISRRLVKSSGHKDWDEAVLRAIDRTASLPRDTDGRVPSPVTIDFKYGD